MFTIKSVYNIFFTFEIINKIHYEDVFFKQRQIYCPNHQTMDMYLFPLGIYNNKLQQIIAMHSDFDRYIPVISWIWYILEHIFVVPKKTIEISIEKLLVNNHLSLMIFPEGYKQRNLKFNENVKNGAFQIALESGLPILPLYHNLGTGMNVFEKTLTYNSHIKIYIGDPIYPGGKSVDELKNEYITQMKMIEEKYFS